MFQITEELIAKLDLSDTKLSFEVPSREYNPEWCAPEGEKKQLIPFEAGILFNSLLLILLIRDRDCHVSCL